MKHLTEAEGIIMVNIIWCCCAFPSFTSVLADLLTNNNLLIFANRQGARKVHVSPKLPSI